MLIETAVSGRTVLVAGDIVSARRSLRRYRAAGAKVHLVQRPQDLAGRQAALLVDVTAGCPRWRSEIAALGRRMLTVAEEPAGASGRITLVGAGPSDPALLTVAGHAALAQADVVLADRLATHDERFTLDELAPGARAIDVGKTPGRHPVPQRQIEALMIGLARAGEHVVRLKGGDPFVFGRGAEEVDAATAAGIPVSVVPGISSALAVPQAVGIPLTDRSTTRSFTVVSGHDPLGDDLCRHLAGSGATIVILMGMATLVQNVAALLRAGLDAATPAAVVQEGCGPRQREVRGPVSLIADRVHRAGLGNPAVVIIGDVAARGDHARVSTDFTSGQVDGATPLSETPGVEVLFAGAGATAELSQPSKLT